MVTTYQGFRQPPSYAVFMTMGVTSLLSITAYCRLNAGMSKSTTVHKLYTGLSIPTYLLLASLLFKFIEVEKLIQYTQVWGVVFLVTTLFVLSYEWRKAPTNARILMLGFLCMSFTYLGMILHGLGIIPWVAYMRDLIHPPFIVSLCIVAFRKVNEARHALETQNERLSKLDSIKNDFLANTSHELRTPLNGIIGLTEGLIESAKERLSSKDLRVLSLVIASSKRLTSLVNDVLDFSKMKHQDLKLNRKPVSIWQVTEFVISLSRPMIGSKPAKLSNDISQKLPNVDADENRLQQILHNLIGNAIKFTDSGEIKIYAVEADDKIKITVSDTGIGIPKEKQETIFKSFEQIDSGADRQYGGTGLGLSITKKLVELHGGTIGINSQENKGSELYFYLPVHKTRTQSTPTERVHSTPEPSSLEEHAESIGSERSSDKAENGFHVLAVDDEPVNLEVICNQLTNMGHRVTTAQDGKAALSKLQNEGPFNLAILDVMMPRMTGFDLCRSIREKYSAADLPVVFLTAKTGSDELLAGFDSGGNDFLTKPFDSKELKVRVDAHLTIQMLAQEIAEKTAEKTALDKDFEAARAVQQALLPPSAEAISGLTIAKHYQSAQQTGGDWYSHYHDRENDRVFIFLGDEQVTATLLLL